jgi:DNA repair protein RadC
MDTMNEDDMDTMNEDDVLRAAESILVSRRRKKPCMNQSSEVARYVRSHAFAIDRECFYVLTVDVTCRLIKMHVVTVGTVCETMVHPREVFRQAIKDNAASIILAHNHPSGDAHVSERDIAITKRLQECAKVLGITILDHVVVGDGELYSFQESGTL